MSNLIRTQVMLPADLLMDLKELASDRNWSVSETVRRASRGLVKKLKPKKMSGVESLWEWAQHPYEGDIPKDLGSNDEYLYGKLAPDYKGDK